MPTIVPAPDDGQVQTAHLVCPECGHRAVADSSRRAHNIVITDARCVHGHIWSVHWLGVA